MERPTPEPSDKNRREPTMRGEEALRQYGGPKDSTSASLWEQLDESGEQNVLDLYSGRITSGEYNRRRKELAVQFRNKDMEIRNSK